LSPILSLLRFFFSSRRRHTRFSRDWSSDVCSSDLTWNSTIGDLFVDLYKALNVYKTFVNNYDRAIGYCTNTALKKKAFVNFLKRSEERRVGKECISMWSGLWYTKQGTSYVSIRLLN